MADISLIIKTFKRSKIHVYMYPRITACVIKHLLHCVHCFSQFSTFISLHKIVEVNLKFILSNSIHSTQSPKYRAFNHAFARLQLKRKFLVYFKSNLYVKKRVKKWQKVYVLRVML